MTSLDMASKKKGRQAQSVEEPSREGSGLFKYFRAVGKVASSIPSKIHYNNGIPYVTTCVGTALLTFDVHSHQPVFLSFRLNP